MTSANEIDCEILNGPNADTLNLRCLTDGQRPFFELRFHDQKIRVEACIESVGYTNCPRALPGHTGARNSWKVTGWIRMNGYREIIGDKVDWVEFSAVYHTNHRRGGMTGKLSHFFDDKPTQR